MLFVVFVLLVCLRILIPDSPMPAPSQLSYKSGDVLPDLDIKKTESTVEDLAKEIHSELAKGLLYAIDIRDGLRLPINYEIKDRDILSIISARKKK